MRADVAMSFLTIKAVDYTPRVDGFGIGDNEWETIAGALGAVRHPGADLLRAIYGGDARACRAVLARLKGALMADMGIDQAHAVSERAVKLFLYPSICPTCQGHGSVIINALKIECKSCQGTGSKPLPHMSCHDEAAYNMLRYWHDSASAIVWTELNSDGTD